MTDWTYQWGDANGVTQTSHYIDPETEQPYQVTDPYEIYGLLKNVYMDKRFPGPLYSAYAPNGTTRQDPVYYGSIAGGWNIPANPAGATTTTDVTFNQNSDYAASTLSKSGVTITNSGGSLAQYNSYYNLTGTTTISVGSGTITKIVFNGSSTSYPVSRLSTNTGSYTTSNNVGTWTGNASSITFTASNQVRCTSIVVTVAKVAEDVNYYRPDADNEGYTAIMVALYNDTTKIYPENMNYYEGSWEFTDSSSLINYIRDNIQFVKLLTDGLRVAEGTRKSGTIFNCDGYYNRFFILGKGQARKKADQLLTNINNGYWPEVCGEEGPFKQMFEQFSPTTGAQYSDVTDFYDKMMEGAVYNVVHDCASVIQNKHQFSMSGKKGTEYKPLSGLNFYIPDYRLLWWSTTSSGYTVDGRDMVPYIATNTSTGEHTGTQFQTGTNIYEFAAWYAQYNKTYPPQMGIYKITLDAEAEQVAYSHDENNENFKVTLTWVSSLDEMSGNTVDQTYTVYYYDRNGNRQKLVVQGQTNTNAETHETTLVYYVPQEAHSYTIDYVVMGTPDDSEHPAFIAWSNVDGVTIPGWDDFLIFELGHHESDFVVKDNGTDKANWYRNFLMVENDLFNGITVTDISKGMNTFNIYRWDNKNQGERLMATLTFDNPTTERVHYTVTYDDNGTNDDMLDQNVYEPEGNADKYKRSTMKIPDQGYVRVRGNGDIIIQPNGYAVNIVSITVKSNGSAINGNSWNSSQNNLPGTWILSPGTLWVKHNTGDYYLEGGGYIAIPNILNNYSNVTVEIKAYGDGSAIARIDVNDDRKDIANGTAATANTYTWENLSNRAAHAPTRATQTVTEDFEDTSIFPSFSTGGITATQHTGAFGDWTLYDGTGGAGVYYSSQENFDNEGEPQAWLPFNPVAISSNVTSAHSGNQYMESICPRTGVASDHWLISPELSGNAQTITFWDREVVTTYGAETYEVLVSYTDNNPASFTKVGDFTTNSTTWQLKSASLPAGSKYFAIRHTSDDIFGLFIDDITYEISSGGTQPVVEGGLLRLGNLPIVDQFKEPIPDDNSHPDTYWYILRYEPEAGSENEPKESGKAKVDIQKTQVKVNGNYTMDQINGDTDAELDMDIISADVTMDLRDSDPYIQLYQMQGKANGDPGENSDWLTRLHGLTSGSFMETYQGTTSEPAYEGTCDATIHHYFSSDTVSGKYNLDNFFTYAPSVSTWGIDRRYFEQDGLDNTYGGPLWKTGVGMVEIQGDPELQKQVINAGTSNEAPNPSTTWTVDGQDYTLYFLGVNAQGYLPKATVSNIKYEPYMFRVFVEGEGLRKFVPVYDTNENGQQVRVGLADGGPIEGKYCVGSFDISSGAWRADLNFQKEIDEEGNYEGNMKFGAPFDLTKDDLMIYVRFYYMTPGWNTRAGDGPDRPGNGSESPGKKPGDPSTYVHEFIVTGEVVGRTYYNAQGMKSDKPFDGINIVVTRYSNGTVSTTKVLH